MTLQTVALNKSYAGIQGVYRHRSRETQTDMTFSVFVPAHRNGTKLSVVWYLSGLTCTHANVTEKGDFRSACAEHGLIFVAPDTSPRGEGVPGDPANAYDFGLGAGFYVDATQAPFSRNYRMWSYVTEELPKLVAEHFPVDATRQSIMGHSMGGHGALTIALRHPNHYRAASAFAPIVAPSRVPWGIKALGGYLGDDKGAWRRHDTVALIDAEVADKSGISGFAIKAGYIQEIQAVLFNLPDEKPTGWPAGYGPGRASAWRHSSRRSARPTVSMRCAAISASPWPAWPTPTWDA